MICSKTRVKHWRDRFVVEENAKETFLAKTECTAPDIKTVKDRISPML